MSHDWIFCRDLPDKIKEEMKKETRETNRDNKERGFAICSKDRSYISGEKCIGTKCRVPIKECPENTIKVGLFHTHPGEDTYPSPIDVAFRLLTERKSFIMCMGSGSEIRCVDLQGVPFPPGKKTKKFEKYKSCWNDFISDCIIKVE